MTCLASTSNETGESLSIIFPKVEHVQICMFDLGDLQGTDLADPNFLKRFEDITNGYYLVEKDNDPPANCVYLMNYQNHYRKRIKSVFRQRREIVIFELKDIGIKNLTCNATLLSSDIIMMKVILTINRIGIGSLSYWLELPSTDAVELCKALREPHNLKANVEASFISYKDPLSIHELMQLITCLVLIRVRPEWLFMFDIPELLSSKKCAIADLHKQMYDKILPTAYRELDTYPVYFFSPNLPIAEFLQLKTKYGREIRGILTGDANWEYKKDATVEKQLKDYEVGTRDSTIWLVDADGTVKVISEKFETPTLESKVLPVFELELLLALKVFLYKVNWTLQNATAKNLSLQSISTLREQMTRDLFEFYNLDISQKDTTRYRIELCKKVLGIDYLHDITIRKFDAITQRLSVQYQRRSVAVQILLTEIFGALGAGLLAYSVISEYADRYYDPQLTPLPKFNLIVLATVFFIFATFLLIYLVFREKRISGA